MVVLSDGDLDIDDVPPELRAVIVEQHDDGELATGDARFAELLLEKSDLPLKAFREAVERAFIVQRLRDNDWNVSRTAELLGITRPTLYDLLEKNQIALPEKNAEGWGT
jgi:DNA-binding NtrC family response regulator